MYTNVFFDFDGTLASEHTGVRESRHAVAAAAAERSPDLDAEAFAQAVDQVIAAAISAAGGMWPSNYHTTNWLREALLSVEAYDEVGDVGVADLAALYGSERMARLTLVPGATELIATAKTKGAIGLITNYPNAELQRRKIDRVGLLEAFDVIVISGEIGVWKPEAGIFEHALQALGASAERSVYIGNSFHHDVIGANNAGLDAIWVPEDGDDADAPRGGSAPHQRFSSLHEVTAWFAGA